MKYSTKVDIVYRAIRSGIERGEYLPGDRIVISRIAKANGCSEIPVREALRRLESEKVVELIPNKGAVVSSVNKSYLEQLFQVLQQDIPVANAQAPQTGAASGENPEKPSEAPRTITVKTVDNTGAATASLVLGILSIVIGLFWALIGVILGIIGIAQAKMGSGSSKAGLAKGGKITSIIGICISVAGWLLNIILTVALI